MVGSSGRRGRPSIAAKSGTSMPPGGFDREEVTIDTRRAFGAYFKPELPGAATSFAVTRVQVEMRSSGKPDGVATAAIMTATSRGVPLSIVAQTPIYERDLPDRIRWTEIKFDNAASLSPTDGACFVIRYNSGHKHVGHIRRELSSLRNRSTILLESRNGGRSWRSLNDMRLRVRVWGTYTTPQKVEIHTGVEFKIRCGERAANTISNGIGTLNQPVAS